MSEQQEKKKLLFPITSEQEYMKDKKVNYLNYCILIYYSNFQNTHDDKFDNGNYDTHRFIYEDQIIKNKDEIEKFSKTKIETFIRNARKLSKLTDESMVTVDRTKEGKIVYKIRKTNKYILIEEKLLRVLINTLSPNAIKVYIFLKWRLKQQGSIISRKEICENIGLSANSKRQLQEITDITKALQKLGLIKRNTITEKSIEGEDYERSTYYELISFDDWEKFWKSDDNPNIK